MSDVKIHNLFPVPIFQYKLKNHEETNQELLNYIYELQKKDKVGNPHSNKGGWHSQNFDIINEGPPINFINKSKDYIGIVTQVGLTTTNGLFFRTNGDNYFDYSIESNFTQVTGNLERINSKVTLTTSHSLLAGDIVSLNVKPNQSVGIGTSVARDTLDVEGVMRLVASRNKVGIVTSASNVLTLDLTSAQTFTCTVDEDINQVKLKNIPSEGSAFTIKFLQDSTGGFSVVSPANNTTGIETFYDNSGDAIDLLWPAGGVIPVVTTGAGKSDIYSFRTFDGGSSFYGVVGGQNFG